MASLAVSHVSRGGSLGFLESGGGELLSRGTKERRAENREIFPSFFFYLFLPSSAPIISPTPPSTHQHKRLPSDTPLRGSFLELSSKTHAPRTHTVLCMVVKKRPRQNTGPNGTERNRRKDRQKDLYPFLRINQACVHI